jgi:hypothetical protein
MDFENSFTQNPVEKKDGEQLETPKKEEVNTPEDIKNAVNRIKAIFINSANQFLIDPEQQALKDQIIKSYSDDDRLFDELSNVFRGVSSEEIAERLEAGERELADKENFINYVNDKSFATSAEERILEEARLAKNRKAKDEEGLALVRNEIETLKVKSPESAPEIKLENCDLSIRAVNYLKVAGFTKLHELTNCTEKELLEKMPFANSKTLKEVKEVLAEHHLDFKK